MKKKLFVLCTALVWAVTLMAQEISVVDTNGNTQLFTMLADAINEAPNGSTIYIPGGRFAIADSVKITKKLTIIGIGHYINNEGNEDGRTIIEGNLWFNGGSSGSAVLACYITGNVNIGDGDASVNDVVIRYCNLNSVQVKNSTCSGTIVNQNYVRGDSSFGMSEVTITNNIICRISDIDSGVIKYNVNCCANYYNYGYGNSNSHPTLINVNNSFIAYNIFRHAKGNIGGGSGNSTNGNFLEVGSWGSSWGDDPIIIDASISDIFENVNDWSVTPVSNFHFKKDYKDYESQVGIYAGTGFNDKQLAPVPYIVAKQVDSETDASGKLNIKIRVKASE